MMGHSSKITQWIIHTVFFVGAAGIAFHIFDVLTRRSTTPVEIIKLDLETPVVKAGGELKFVWSFLRRRYCKSNVYEILMTGPDDKGIPTVVDRGQILTGATDIGVINKRRWIYNVPPWLPPGQYTLSHVYHSDCGDYVHSQRAPTLNFTVVRGDPS